MDETCWPCLAGHNVALECMLQLRECSLEYVHELGVADEQL